MINLIKFLAMDEREYRNSCEGRRGVCEYSESGQHVAEVGSLIPVIVKGKTCAGYAEIVSVTIKANVTTFAFKFLKINTDIARGIWNYYQSSTGRFSGTGDRYEDATDNPIPGIYRGGRSATSVDIGDDDDDEFDPDDSPFMNLGGFNYKPKKKR